MSKSSLLFVLLIFVAWSPAAYSDVANADLDRNSVSNAYARLIQAERQLLKTELAVEAKKSADFESLLADGHASWLENRQQKLVVDILRAELAAYEQFESQTMETLTDGEITFASNFGSVKDSTKTRLETIQELQQELTSLRQAEAKLAHGVMNLPANDPWVMSSRLKNAVTSQQANVVAAKIMLLEQLISQRDKTNESSKFVSATQQGSAFTAAWKRSLKDSSSMKLMIAQAELQIQLSQHHFSNETQRLANIQDLKARGMATEKSMIESKQKVDVIKELLDEQIENLNWLKKDSPASPSTDRTYSNVKARPAGDDNAIYKNSPATQSSSTALQSTLNHFGLGQANYLKREAILKGEMYREVLSRLEQAVAFQTNQTRSNGTSADFSNVLISGQQRELEQYRWKIKKTELQRDLASAEIALLEQSGGSQRDNFNILVSAGVNSGSLLTLPSRFHSSDPFGLQTTYSALAFNSPAYKARLPVSSTRSNLSSAFRPIINRDALTLYLGIRSAQLRNFSRANNFRSFNSGFQSIRFGGSPFRSNFHFNSFGRSSQFSAGSGFGRIGY